MNLTCRNLQVNLNLCFLHKYFHSTCKSILTMFPWQGSMSYLDTTNKSEVLSLNVHLFITISMKPRVTFHSTLNHEPSSTEERPPTFLCRQHQRPQSSVYNLWAIYHQSYKEDCHNQLAHPCLYWRGFQPSTISNIICLGALTNTKNLIKNNLLNDVK